MKHLIAITLACCALAATATNRSYCRVVSEGHAVAYAPDFFPPSLTPATPADYAARGWLKNGILPPSPPTGYTCTNTTYEAQGEAVIAVYAYGPIPRTPVKYSKLKIYGAICSLPDANGETAWSRVKAWMEAKTIEGLNGWTAFELAQEISDDHPLFAPLAAEAQTLLGLTDDQFAALLAACVLED